MASRYPALNKVLYAYRYALSFGFCEGVAWLIASATPMLLLLQQLGGTPFQSGLAYSFGFLMLPLQVISTALLPHLGYKNQVIFSWITRSLFLLIPLFLAFSAPSSPASWMPNLMIWGLFFFAVLRSTGSSAWYPWLYAIIPKRIQGLYFSVDQTLINGAGVIILLFSSILFYVFSVYQAFTLIYTLAMLASIGAIYSLFRLPSVKQPETINLKGVWIRSQRLCFQAGPFKFFLIITLIWFLIGTPYMPFTVYYLNKNLAVSDGVIIFYTGIQYLGAILTAWLCRRALDRFGVRPFFTIALLSCILVKVYWLLMLAGMSFLLRGIGIVFLINGISTVLWQIAYLKYIPQLCDDSDRSLGVALQIAVVGFTGGLAPILWGLLLGQGIAGHDLHTGVFIIYFILAIIVLSALIVPFASIKEDHPERPSLQNPRGLIRLFRFITKIGNLIDNNKRMR